MKPDLQFRHGVGLVGKDGKRVREAGAKPETSAPEPVNRSPAVQPRERPAREIPKTEPEDTVAYWKAKYDALVDERRTKTLERVRRHRAKDKPL